jgi:non-canonical poly(A) RNA polymerase PAPD5/7
MEDFVPLDVEEPKQPRVYTRPAAASRPAASSPRKRKREDENVFPWTPSVDWDACPSATAQLSAEINSFYEWVKPSQREHGIRTALIQSIRSAVKSRWPDSEVEPFGSYKTQLYLPSG